MPDLSQVQPATFPLQGGLVLNKSTFAMSAGEALELINFEPDISGGYRRISGFAKYNTNIVPQTSASSETVLMSAFYNDNIIAARGTNIFRGTKGSTTISQDHNDSVTTITVASTTDFSTTGTILLGSEQITYTGKTSTTLTGATRGANSTSAASHSSGATVTQYWTSIDSSRTSAGVYTFATFNFDGTKKFIVADGANAPTVFNTSFAATDVAHANASTGESTTLVQDIASGTGMTGSGVLKVASTTGFTNPSSGTLTLVIGTEQFTYTGLTSTTFTGVTRGAGGTEAVDHTAGTTVSDAFPPAVSGSKFVAVFKDTLFYAGMSAKPQEVVFTVPFEEDNFSVALGAGSFRVDDTITGLKVFRDNLFIFCENRIFKLSGSSFADFRVDPVTRNIGCVNGQTIQEFAGDLIFLAPDGLRTVAGTARIGDVDLGTISTAVQSVFNDNIANSGGFRSLVIPNKTQYRVFFTKDGVSETITNGVICSMREANFEFAKLKGIKPTSTDTLVESAGTTVVHGGADGYIYQQESGNDFNGTSIDGKYRSPDLSFGDAGVRKHMQKVLLSYKPESSVNADLLLRYDYEDPDSPRPAAYSLSAADVAAVYGASGTTYGTSTYGGQSEPLVRQAVEGSGFTVALRVNDNGVSAPYSIRGFGLEYQMGARR